MSRALADLCIVRDRESQRYRCVLTCHRIAPSPAVSDAVAASMGAAEQAIGWDCSSACFTVKVSVRVGFREYSPPFPTESQASAVLQHCSTLNEHHHAGAYTPLVTGRSRRKMMPKRSLEWRWSGLLNPQGPHVPGTTMAAQTPSPYSQRMLKNHRAHIIRSEQGCSCTSV